METVLRETAFDDVMDSQHVFRVLLDSMSRPGKVYELNSKQYRGTPEGLNPFTLSVLKTLLDHRVTFSLGGMFAPPEWISYLRINTGSSWAEQELADYVVFEAQNYTDGFTRLKKGSLEFPERSATALLSVTELHNAADGESFFIALTLRGPGVKDTTTVHVRGLDRRYIDALALMNVFYPLGIDVILFDDVGRVTSIPRTSKVEVS